MKKYKFFTAVITLCVILLGFSGCEGKEEHCETRVKCARITTRLGVIIPCDCPKNLCMPQSDRNIIYTYVNNFTAFRMNVSGLEDYLHANNWGNNRERFRLRITEELDWTFYTRFLPVNGVNTIHAESLCGGWGNLVFSDNFLRILLSFSNPFPIPGVSQQYLIISARAFTRNKEDETHIVFCCHDWISNLSMWEVIFR